MNDKNLYVGEIPQQRECSRWIRLGPAGAVSGLSPRMLAHACSTGQIPVAIRQIGPRLKFVHYGQLMTWLGIEARQAEAAHMGATQQRSRGHVAEPRVIRD